LTVADRAALAGYCVAYAHWLEAEEFLETNGTTFVMRDDKGVVKGRFAVPEVGIAVKMLDKIRQFAAEFGFTPSARGRIELGKVVELEGLENEELERERDRIKALLADEAPRDRKGSVH
jgi:P27 family predicted phage terminase small subunit